MSKTAEFKTWYAVYTKPRAERKLRDILDNLSIENYLPLVRARKRWSDRYKWVEEPAFASYIFVRINFNEQALSVQKQPQTLKFVRSGVNAIEISDNDVELLRLALENYAELLTIRDTSTLEAGQTVRIKDGPFAGKEAVIARIQGRTMILVAFPALNKSVQVEIPVGQIGKL
jgi:transcriptional antiterminator RfaH